MPVKDEVIVELKEILGRVDERVKVLIDSNAHLAERFDKFVELHAKLSERVTHLEVVVDQDKVEEVEDAYHELRSRLDTVEDNSNKLSEMQKALFVLERRVDKLEHDTKLHESTVANWTTWLFRIGEAAFKVVWVLAMAYILYRLGLGGVNFPP